MDRSYLAPHRVAVYTDQAAKDAGTASAVVSLVPYPHKGFDNYKYRDVMYPGYTDRHGHEACVMLNEPLFPRRS